MRVRIEGEWVLNDVPSESILWKSPKYGVREMQCRERVTCTERHLHRATWYVCDFTMGGGEGCKRFAK